MGAVQVSGPSAERFQPIVRLFYRRQVVQIRHIYVTKGCIEGHSAGTLWRWNALIGEIYKRPQNAQISSEFSQYASRLEASRKHLLSLIAVITR